MTADKWTEDELKRLEKRITKEYGIAGKELSEKLDRYLNGYDEVKDGKLIHHAGMYERKEKEFLAMTQGKYTEKQFREWMASQVGRGSHWEDMKEQMAERLAESNMIAQGYINGVLPTVYTKNSNEIATIAQKSAMDEGVLGIRFDMVDERTIKRLMEGSREVLPYKRIDINLPRVNQWNMTKLQNAMLQGILQGESMSKIADRFERVANMNRSQSIRSARTAVTGAQNAGKQDRYSDLASQGCEITKIWVATSDERTREEHAEADGQEVSYNEPFDVGGEELMYPADPSGSDWNIYNCRCTMHTGKIRFR